MDGNNIKLLHEIGVPAGIVGLVVVAMMLRKLFPRVARFGACVALAALVVFVSSELYPLAAAALIKNDVRIETEPTEWQGYSNNGVPTSVRIRAMRAGGELAQRMIAAPESTQLAERPLVLRAGPASAERFDAIYNDTPVGWLRPVDLRQVGWNPAPAATGVAIHAWPTVGVRAPTSIELAGSGLGKLLLHVVDYTATANVTLELQGHSDPDPPILALNNKQHSVQTFDGLHEFTILVREADFTSGVPRAAFIVVGP